MAEQSVVDVAAQVVWLFGHPVGHSLSPLMQNAAFHHAGLELTYIARDVGPDELGAAVAELREPHSRGANLTVPHKERVLALLDAVDEEAGSIGAVNTVVNVQGTLKGYNTDLGGFLTALKRVLPAGAEGNDCLVLGAGGAARAVVAALQRDGARRVWVANRTIKKAAALCGAAEEWGSAECLPIRLDESATVCQQCQVVVNATSVGLSGSVKELPLDVDKLHDGQVLMDLVYGIGPTPLVQAARDRGLAAVDGREMLVQQAALSFGLWTGLDAPVDLMRGSTSDSQG